MFCKSVKSNKQLAVFVIIGVISMVFGVVGYWSNPDLPGNSSMLLGMFSGLGCAFIVISVIQLLRNKFSSAEKLKQSQINMKDERNIQILRASYTVTYVASTILFAVMAFVFVWLNYMVPAFIAIGAIWVQVIVFLISYNYLSKKM